MRNLCLSLAAVAVLALGCGGSDVPEDPTLAPDLSVLTFGGTFGNAVYVDSGLQQTLQLKNTGKKDLTVASVTIEGADAALFSAVSSGQTAATDEIVFVVVTYAPKAAGKHGATLVINSNSASYSLTRGELAPLEIGPVTKIELTGQAVYRFKTMGHVSDGTKALPGIKVTCNKPAEADAKWAGWDMTTDAEGKWTKEHSWSCKDLTFTDSTGVYKALTTTWNPEVDLAITMVKN